MRYILALCTLFAPAAIAAQPLMTAQEFDAYTKGKTFYYGAQGAPYGAEEYLDDRRVRWSFLDGRCQEGIWYEENDLICFVYDGKPEPQCWSFQRSGAGLIAQFENDPNQTVLYEMEKSGEPLHCLGPEVGA